MTKRTKCCLAGMAVIMCTWAAGAATTGDWTQFRGVGGLGKADAAGLPAKWDSKKNIVWKSELPGPGTSSPIIVGNKIFITCYSGYAESIDDPGDKDDLKRHLVCVDRDSGKILWQKDFKAKQPESDYSGGNNIRHGYASSTPVSDGRNLYVFFGISGVYAFDLNGKELWKKDVGDGTHGWGSATSLLLYKDLLIVNASVESEKMIAMNKSTGKKVWEVGDVVKCWSSPMLVDVGGKQELVLSIPDRKKPSGGSKKGSGGKKKSRGRRGGGSSTSKIRGFDPATGKELWRCEGPPDSYLCPSVVSHDGVIYSIGARKNTAIAVRAGGKGDVTGTHLLWKASVGSNVTSPVYLDGHLYFMHEKGKAVCLDAKTGDVVFEEELDPKPALIYASVLAADGKLYAPSQDDGTYVVEAKPRFKQLAVNKFQDDPSRVNASVVASHNQLIMRTDKAIYCIGTK